MTERRRSYVSRVSTSGSHVWATRFCGACRASATVRFSRCRTARCEGEVFGDTADTALDRLASLAAACAPGLRGTLYLPTGEQFTAAVSRFAYTAQGDGRVLAYVIDFLEYGVEAAS